MALAVEVSRLVPEVWQVGLALQVVGTGVAGLALRGEWRDRVPKVPTSGNGNRRNPFERGSLVTVPFVPGYRMRESKYGQIGTSSGQRPASVESVEAVAQWTAKVNKETREWLAADWDAQERAIRDLMERTETFLSSIRETQQATRRRVLLELLGLFLVTLGTFVSSPLFS